MQYCRDPCSLLCPSKTAGAFRTTAALHHKCSYYCWSGLLGKQLYSALETFLFFLCCCCADTARGVLDKTGWTATVSRVRAMSAGLLVGVLEGASFYTLRDCLIHALRDGLVCVLRDCLIYTLRDCLILALFMRRHRCCSSRQLCRLRSRGMSAHSVSSLCLRPPERCLGSSHDAWCLSQESLDLFIDFSGHVQGHGAVALIQRLFRTTLVIGWCKSQYHHHRFWAARLDSYIHCCALTRAMLSCIHWGAMPCLPQLLRGNTSNSCDIRLEGHHFPKRLFWMRTVSNLTSLQYHQHLKTRLQNGWLRTDISSCPFEQKLKS